jgi:hypothetical protein
VLNSQQKTYLKTWQGILEILCWVSLVGGLLAIALTKDLWSDEMVSVNFIANSNPYSVLWDNHPPLYYLFGKLWYFFFGANVFWLRFPSIIFSVAAIYYFQKSLEVAKISIPRFVPVLILGTFSVIFRHATEIRPQALFFFFCSWAFYEYLLARKNSKYRLSLYISFLGMMLTSYNSLLLFPWFFLKAMFSKRMNLKNKFTLCAVLIVVATIAYSMIGWESLFWHKNAFNEYNLIQFPVRLFLSLFKGHGIAVGFFIVLFFIPDKKGTIYTNDSKFLVANIVMVTWMLSAFLQRDFAYDRYFIILVTPIVFLICYWLTQTPKYFSLALLAVFLYPQFVDTEWYLSHRKSGWEEMSQYVDQLQCNGPILSPRADAVHWPYFDHQMWRSEQIKPMIRVEDVKAYMDTHPCVIIYDSMFSAVRYFDDVRTWAQAMHIGGIMKQFGDGTQEPLSVLVLDKTENVFQDIH